MAIDQHARRCWVEPTKAELWEAGCLEASNLALAGGEKHDDALGLEPPGDEGKRVRGRVVEPLRIVDETKERLAFCCLGEQAQGCERDKEAVPSSPLRQAESSAKGSRLRLWKILYVTKDRVDDLVQRGKRELRLRLDAGAAEHAHAVGLVARVLQER
jgi:hypothetical protein